MYNHVLRDLCDNIGLVGVSAKWSYVTASPSHHEQAIPILSPLLFMHVGHPYIPLFKIRRLFDLLVCIWSDIGLLYGVFPYTLAAFHSSWSSICIYTSVKIIKNEVGYRDDTVPKTIETRRQCEDGEHATIFRNPQKPRCRERVAEDCCMLSILALPSCFNSFWHGVIPTSYFIFNDFYTCSTHFFCHKYGQDTVASLGA